MAYCSRWLLSTHQSQRPPALVLTWARKQTASFHLRKTCQLSQTWCYVSIIPALRRYKQEDPKFKAITATYVFKAACLTTKKKTKTPGSGEMTQLMKPLSLEHGYQCSDSSTYTVLAGVTAVWNSIAQRWREQIPRANCLATLVSL